MLGSVRGAARKGRSYRDQAMNMPPLRGSDRALEGVQREAGGVCSGAPEARQKFSLGREPQEPGD